MNARLARGMLVVSTALAVSLIFAFYAAETSRLEKNTMQELEIRAVRISEAIAESLDLARARVQSVVALFAASDMVSEQEFSVFVRGSGIFKEGDHIRAVAVMPFLSPGDSDRVSARLRERAASRRSLGYPSISLAPNEGQQAQAPVLYVESPQGRSGILGYDLAANPSRLRTALKARASGQVLVTPPVKLSQDKAQSYPSILLVASVEHGNMGLRPHLPREAARPVFVAVSFTPGTLIEAVLDRFSDAPTAMEIVDVTDPVQPITVFGADQRADTNPVATERIKFGGRDWRLQFSSTGLLPAPSLSSWRIALYALSLALLAALAVAANRLISNREHLSDRVNERTRELSTANAKLHALSRDAKEANRVKSAFLASMSHEFRTPLNAILGFSEMLSAQHMRPPTTEKAREYAGDIHKSGSHLLALVDDILDLTKVEAGRTSVDCEQLDSRTILTDCLTLINGEARANDVRITIPAVHDSIGIYADQRALKQILVNLLSNAVKFTPPGGMVIVMTRQVGHTSEVTISDTGVGIPDNRLSDVLGPFVRVNQDPHIAGQGSGLGLSITKSLIDLHNGTLNIASKLGKGTTVTVTFPGPG